MKRTAPAEPIQPAIIVSAIPKQDAPARLAALPNADIRDLKEQWRSLFGTEPPPYNRRFLERRIAYRIQELAYGGLKPETIARLEALGEQIDGGNITLRRIRQDQRPGPQDGLGAHALMNVQRHRVHREARRLPFAGPFQPGLMAPQCLSQ
ncbi:MAG: DUF2924 domain-containing protein [Roseomonas sp.]|nr:DUF2924 domain-containing protein [Roseomonas sp.]MCA3431673.1 DUF2924 domain-containing protein [Roseomonas sp.]MCA3432275.1 DUF2924 domain-containing protein [Roseomonas sp.]